MFLKLVLNLARIRGDRSLQELFDHYPPNDIRMPMLAGEVRDNSPNVQRSQFKSIPKSPYGSLSRGRPIDQCYDRRIPPAIKNFLQPELQRAELPPAWIRIGHQKRSTGIGNRRERALVSPCHDDYEIAGRRKRT